MADSFGIVVEEFLRGEKMPLTAPRWRIGQHPDYAELKMPVAVEGSRHLRGFVIVAAHRLIMPPKVCFSLLFRRTRLLALDVNPRRFHKNLLTPQSIGGTHWQSWPLMEAVEDNREQIFPVWLHEFLVRANVTCRHRVQTPPRGVQLDFLNG